MGAIGAIGAMGAMGAATGCAGLGSTGAGGATGRDSGIEARACSVARGALETGAGRVLAADGAARGASAGAVGRGATPAPRDVEGFVPRGVEGLAAGAVGAGASSTTSEIRASDCSTPPVATSAAGAACCVSGDGRLARNAPAAPTVMHDAATTATVLVRISMNISRADFGRV